MNAGSSPQRPHLRGRGQPVGVLIDLIGQRAAFCAKLPVREAIGPPPAPDYASSALYETGGNVTDFRKQTVSDMAQDKADINFGTSGGLHEVNWGTEHACRR